MCAYEPQRHKSDKHSNDGFMSPLLGLPAFQELDSFIEEVSSEEKEIIELEAKNSSDEMMNNFLLKSLSTYTLHKNEDLKEEPINVLDYHAGKEVLNLIDKSKEITVIHFTSNVSSDEYIDLMVDKIYMRELRVTRIVFYNEFLSEAHYYWLNKFRNDQGKLLNGYKEYIFKGRPLPFDISVFDESSTVLRLPSMPDSKKYKNILLLRDKRVASLFKHSLTNLLKNEDSYLYGHPEFPQESVKFPRNFLAKHVNHRIDASQHFHPLRQRLLQLRGEWEGIACRHIKKGYEVNLKQGKFLAPKTIVFIREAKIILRTKENTEVEGVCELRYDFSQLEIPDVSGDYVTYGTLKGDFANNKLHLFFQDDAEKAHTAEITLELDEEGCNLYGTWARVKKPSGKRLHGSLVIEKVATTEPWDMDFDGLLNLISNSTPIN